MYNMKQTKGIWLVMIAVMTVQLSFAQLSAKYKTYEQKWSKGLRYGLFKPANYDPKKSYPLVLYLHGANDTISRDITWYHETIQRENPTFVLAPKCTNPNQGWGNTWTDAHSPAMVKTLQVIDSLLARYSIDKNRLYVYGISMGGFGVFLCSQRSRESLPQVMPFAVGRAKQQPASCSIRRCGYSTVALMMS